MLDDVPVLETGRHRQSHAIRAFGRLPGLRHRRAGCVLPCVWLCAAGGTLLLAYVLGQLGGLLPLPGGLGGIDAGLIGALVVYGEPIVPATTAVLVYYAVHLLLPVLLGVPAFVGLEDARHRFQTGVADARDRDDGHDRGPVESLTLHHNTARPTVVLSGGIGITPFRSILLQAAKARLRHRIVFFYANRRPEDAPFFDDMRTVEQENPNFTFIPTMGEMDKTSLPWDGETGRIDASMLARHLSGRVAPIYHITGPPGMMKGMQAVLKSTGVDTDDIRVEGFTGY